MSSLENRIFCWEIERNDSRFVNKFEITTDTRESNVGESRKLIKQNLLMLYEKKLW